MAFDPLTAVLSIGEKVIDKIFPDKTEAEKAKVRMAELAMQGGLEELKEQVKLILGQLEINKIEATHSSIWVAGWRPFCGWVCGSSLAYHYMLQPFLVTIFSLFKVTIIPPPIDIAQLMVILLGMLGIAGYRTWEKGKDVEGNR